MHSQSLDAVTTNRPKNTAKKRSVSLSYRVAVFLRFVAAIIVVTPLPVCLFHYSLCYYHLINSTACC